MLPLKFVVPELIVHYIEAHCYLPPQEFIAAVMQCPPQGCAEFFQLLSGFENWWDAQQIAPPNGGPAARSVSSGVTEGPPSVS